MIFIVEGFKISPVKGLPYALRKIVVKIKVMRHRKSHSQRFLCLYQVSYIRTAVISAGGAIAGFGNGTGVLCVLFIEKVHFALPCKKISVPCVS